jgi:hypothetical protein
MKIDFGIDRSVMYDPFGGTHGQETNAQIFRCLKVVSLIALKADFVKEFSPGITEANSIGDDRKSLTPV